jgi:hypothetical protein
VDNLTIFSRDHRTKAELTLTGDGTVRVIFLIYRGEVERRGINVEEQDLPNIQGRWKVNSMDVVDQPFHVVADHVHELLYGRGECAPSR